MSNLRNAPSPYALVAGLVAGLVLALVACGDSDAPQCTMTDVCERNVECKIVATVAMCEANIGSCANEDAFVECMCKCQAEADACLVEHCIPDCQPSC